MTDVREITRSPPIVASSAISCSVIPSAKYSCSGSPDRSSSGSTAMDRIWLAGGVVDQRWNPPAISHAANPAIAVIEDRGNPSPRSPRVASAVLSCIDSDTRFSSRMTSPAVCHRSSGFLARQRRTMSSTRRRHQRLKRGDRRAARARGWRRGRRSRCPPRTPACRSTSRRGPRRTRTDRCVRPPRGLSICSGAM